MEAPDEEEAAKGVAQGDERASLGGVQIRLRRASARASAVKIKPTLAEESEKRRVERRLDDVDRAHGRARLTLKLEKRALRVDESRLYVAKGSLKAPLIEETDALTAPKTRRKPRAQKATLPSATEAP